MADGFTTRRISDLGSAAALLPSDLVALQRSPEAPALKSPISAFVAVLDQLGAGGRAALRAEQARDEAISIVEASTGVVSVKTKALADAAADALPAGTSVNVWSDESRSNSRTIYEVQADGSLLFVKNLDQAWMASALGGTVFYVESYRDPSKGIMADTLALRDAIAAAGEGGVVRGRKGQEYVIRGGINLRRGQIFEGFGARIRRGDAITTTTTTAIVANTSLSVTVADASAFRIGMEIAVQTSPVAGTGNRWITAIAGNVITVAAVFDVSIGAGATLRTSHLGITADQGDNTGLIIRGWEIDGNRAANSGFTNWVNHAEINVFGPGLSVEHNWIHDAQGEGIYAYASVGGDTSPHPYVVQFNRVEDCNGNGIHMSAATSGKVLYNWVRNTNLRPNGDIGHDDGCIAFSFNGPDWQVVGNYCENGLAGIGDLGTFPYTGDGIIAHNVVRGCETPIGRQLFAQSGGRVQILGNRFYDSGVWSLTQTDVFDPDRGFQHVLVAHNLFFDTRIEIMKSRDIDLTGNQFFCPSNTTHAIVNIYDVQNVSLNGDRIVGGAYGVYVAGEHCDEVELTNVRARDQHLNGITVEPGTVPVGAVDVVNPSVSVGPEANTAAGYNGIILSNGTTLKGGKIRIRRASTGAGVMCPNGGVGVRGAIITGVTVDAPDAAHSVRAFGGSRNNIIVGNFLDKAVTNGGGADNTVENNYLLAA